MRRLVPSLNHGHGVAEYEIIEFVLSKADPRLAVLLQ